MYVLPSAVFRFYRLNRTRCYHLLSRRLPLRRSDFFFFNRTAPPDIYTLSLHDALPISSSICRSHSSTANSSNQARSSARSAGGSLVIAASISLTMLTFTKYVIPEPRQICATSLRSAQDDRKRIRGSCRSRRLPIFLRLKTFSGDAFRFIGRQENEDVRYVGGIRPFRRILFGFR